MLADVQKIMELHGYRNGEKMWVQHYREEGLSLGDGPSFLGNVPHRDVLDESPKQVSVEDVWSWFGGTFPGTVSVRLWGERGKCRLLSRPDTMETGA